MFFQNPHRSQTKSRKVLYLLPGKNRSQANLPHKTKQKALEFHKCFFCFSIVLSASVRVTVKFSQLCSRDVEFIICTFIYIAKLFYPLNGHPSNIVRYGGI